MLEVADTEFPCFELLAAFSAFSLQPTDSHANAKRRRVQEPHAWVLNAMARLADAFGVDRAALLEQFQDHRRLAQTERDQGGPDEPTVCSWQRALQKSQAGRKNQWPVTALLPVLQRFVVCPGSTSGIEQAFSKFKRLMGEQWHGSAEAEERRLVLRLKAADTPQLPLQLLRAARRIWVSCFGPARPSGPLRRPSLGVKETVRLRKAAREAAAAPCSAAAWLRKRSRDVAAAATAPTPTSRTAGPERSSAQALMDADQAWTAAHEQEAQRQRKVRIDRACAAVLEGTANQSCLRALGATTQALVDFQKREENRQCGLEVQWRRKASAQALPEKVELHGKRLFIEGEARGACGLEPQWRAATGIAGVTEVRDRAAAQVFVVLNPSDPGDRNKAIASMVGGLLCTPGFVLEARSGAVAFQLLRALSMPRYIFVSKGTSSNHRNGGPHAESLCSGGALALAQQAGAKISHVAMVHRHARPAGAVFERARSRGKDHASEMVTLVTGGERLPDFPRPMCLRASLASIHRVDRRCTRVGYCQ